jgi:RNA polymerase sigma-70 factor (ECF subfamily)
MQDPSRSRTDYSLLLKLTGTGLPEPADWEEFDRIYRPRVYDWCRQQGRHDADASEVSQAVMVKLLEQLRSFDPRKGRFRPWLRRVTRNAWIDYVRQREKGRGSGDTAVLAQLDNVPAADSLADHLDREWERDLLQTALTRVQKRVSPENWEIFNLLTFERPAAEVAERFDKKVAAVWRVNSRVRKMLREEVQRLKGPDPEGV